MRTPNTYVIDTAARLYDELIIAEHRVTCAEHRAAESTPSEADRLRRRVGYFLEKAERARADLLAYAEDENLIERATHVGIAAKRRRSWPDEDAVGIIADFLRSEGHRFVPLKPALADLAQTSDVSLDQIAQMGERIATAIEGH